MGTKGAMRGKAGRVAGKGTRGAMNCGMLGRTSGVTKGVMAGGVGDNIKIKDQKSKMSTRSWFLAEGAKGVKSKKGVKGGKGLAGGTYIKRENGKGKSGKGLAGAVVGWGAIVLLLCMVAGEAGAKSVFAISDLNAKKIQAYSVQPYELILQAEQTLTEVPSTPIALAIAESPEGSFLFVTSERCSIEINNIIEVYDARLLTHVSRLTIPGAGNLAGIVYDAEHQRIYAVDRYTQHLYSYRWNAGDMQIEPDFPVPYYITLPEFNAAFGIAYDESTDRLYVANNTGFIHFYDVKTWDYEGYVEVQTDALAVAVDTVRQRLYYGSIGDYGQSWDWLGWYDLATPADQSIYTGASVCGITVDNQTGNVFATTFGTGEEYVYPADSPRDSIQMFSSYDPNTGEYYPDTLMRVWDSPDVGNPTGIVIGPTYKQLRGVVEKVDDVNEITSCVLPDDIYHYYISYHAGPLDETNVVVTDCLPVGVDFISADPNTGTYDSDEHIYIWNIGDVAGEQNYYFELAVQVNNRAEPLGQLHNKVVAEGDLFCNWADEYTPVGCSGGDVIYVDFYAEGSNAGTNWTDAYTDLQDALTRAAKSCGNEIWVAQGIYNRPGDGIIDY